MCSLVMFCITLPINSPVDTAPVFGGVTILAESGLPFLSHKDIHSFSLTTTYCLSHRVICLSSEKKIWAIIVGWKWTTPIRRISGRFCMSAQGAAF